MSRIPRSLMFAVLLLALSAGAAFALFDRYTIPGHNVYPEGIAVQPATGDFYVGSTTSGDIFRGNVDSPALSLFLPGGADGRTSAIGMKLGRHNRLYVAGGPTGQIFVYDVNTRALVAKFSTGVSPTFINDVVIAPNGDAYFTDSLSPFLYRIDANVRAPDALEKISLAGSPIVYEAGFNLNGIAAWGRYLVMVQSNTGKLFRMDLITRAISEITVEGGSVAGGDGLLLEGRRLYLIRNAAGLFVTLQLSHDFSTATVLSSVGNPDFINPTTFGRIGDRFLIVNAQFSRQATNNPILPFYVLSIPAPTRAHH